MTAFAATASYELRMQLRKPAIWIATAIPFGLFAVLAAMGTQNMERLTQDTDPKTWMAASLGWFTPLLAMVFGFVLADRLVRDRKLGVAQLLDVTPSNPSARLFGKYLGACAATAVPPALIYLIVGVTFAIWRGRPTAGSGSSASVAMPPSMRARAARDIDAYDRLSRSPRSPRVAGPWTSRCLVTASSPGDNALSVTRRAALPLITTDPLYA